jgi:hypothetical protein
MLVQGAAPARSEGVGNRSERFLTNRHAPSWCTASDGSTRSSTRPRKLTDHRIGLSPNSVGQRPRDGKPGPLIEPKCRVIGANGEHDRWEALGCLGEEGLEQMRPYPLALVRREQRSGKLRVRRRGRVPRRMIMRKDARPDRADRRLPFARNYPEVCRQRWRCE